MKEINIPITFKARSNHKKHKGLISLQTWDGGMSNFYILSNYDNLDGNGAPDKKGYHYSWQISERIHDEDEAKMFLNYIKKIIKGYSVPANEKCNNLVFDFPSRYITNIFIGYDINKIKFKEIIL